MAKSLIKDETNIAFTFQSSKTSWEINVRSSEAPDQSRMYPFEMSFGLELLFWQKKTGYDTKVRQKPLSF